MVLIVDEGREFFWNVWMIVSNLAFLITAYPCIKARKYIAGVFFVYICLVSSIYHACKWGPEDKKGYGGYCIPGVSIEMMYAMDFFCSQMSIPIVTTFFIHPKTSIINIEELYKKDIKKHKKWNNNNNDNKNTIGAMATSKINSNFERNSNKTPHKFIVKFIDGRDPQKIYTFGKKTEPWVMLHYDLYKKKLEVLDLENKRINNNNNPSERTTIYSENQISRNNNISFSLKDNYYSKNNISNTSFVENVVPELWCKKCNTKIEVSKKSYNNIDPAPNKYDTDNGVFGKGNHINISTKYGHFHHYPPYQQLETQKNNATATATATATAATMLDLECNSSDIDGFGHRIAYLDSNYYCSISATTKECLSYIEIYYILYHVLVLAVSIKLVGPSFIHITLPLILFNSLVIIWVILVSYLSTLKLKWKKENFSIEKIQSKPRCCSCSFLCFRSFFMKLLPNKTLFGVDVLKSLEWTFGVHKTDHEKRYGKKRENVLYLGILSYKQFYLILSLIFGMTAIILFSTQNMRSVNDYEWTHPLWHILGAFGLYIVFGLVL